MMQYCTIVAGTIRRIFSIAACPQQTGRELLVCKSAHKSLDSNKLQYPLPLTLLLHIIMTTSQIPSIQSSSSSSSNTNSSPIERSSSSKKRTMSSIDDLLCNLEASRATMNKKARKQETSLRRPRRQVGEQLVVAQSQSSRARDHEWSLDLDLALGGSTTITPRAPRNLSPGLQHSAAASGHCLILNTPIDAIRTPFTDRLMDIEDRVAPKTYFSRGQSLFAL